MALKRLLASALSTESKYQTVMAYLRAETRTRSGVCVCACVCACVCVGCSPAGVGGPYLVRVPAVGPEEEQPVEERRDVGRVGAAVWEDPEDAAVLLINNAAVS